MKWSSDMVLDRSRGWEFVGVLVLSTMFTVALFYLTFEIPIILDGVLHHYFPEVFYDAEAAEKMLGTLRPIGYSALALTIALIILGFVIKRGTLTFLGSLTLYIPTFSYFALAMFFLTGLGVLRALWLPALELSPSILKLGCVVYLPFSVIPDAPLVGIAITCVGLFLFSFGVASWLYGRFKGYELVDLWIYKYSRHPQYLGFILWSYGLLVFVSYKSYIRGAFTTPPALLWLLSTTLIIGVALFEELEMIKKYGEKYEKYRERTPFMIPLPKTLRKIIAKPVRIMAEYPRSIKGIITLIVLCTITPIAISYVLMLTSLC